eukprot:CAMPEP_0116891788 /NCGR_PEP_ID=MMETSP0467-20121206/2131_1 /TAXON_ID=283647 /ORGANISM="Mesodinium pulex, Strain SPMC105" /LENGTH=120 /DNA_ID=CAMNT_0004560507 /DNA_START=1763 /DNA_END=2124 /DNA_ORIENTATION=-
MSMQTPHDLETFDFEQNFYDDVEVLFGRYLVLVVEIQDVDVVLRELFPADRIEVGAADFHDGAAHDAVVLTVDQLDGHARVLLQDYFQHADDAVQGLEVFLLEERSDGLIFPLDEIEYEL